MSGRLRRLGLVAALGAALLVVPAAAQDHERVPVPGAVDARVTQATIHATICQRGYTATVRRPQKWTDTVKRRLVGADDEMLARWGPRE